MLTEANPNLIKSMHKFLGYRVTSFITFFFILTAITSSTVINESYLIEPLSDQSFIVVKLPTEHYKPTVFELLKEN
jgi:hypothetical protein